MSDKLTIPAKAISSSSDSLAAITQNGPESYQSNILSCQRCHDAGQLLLDEAQRNGMSDDLDRRLASYIEKTRKTLRAMNERRAPLTKLFDQVRSEFTALENAIDPSKKDTVPYLIAQCRNAYAAQKRLEEEQRRQAELAAQEIARAKETYRVAVEEDYWNSFSRHCTTAINELRQLSDSLTLDNYEAVRDRVAAYPATLAPEWSAPSAVRLPHNLSPDETKEIRQSAFARLRPKFDEQYIFDVDEYRREILDTLPSRINELRRIAQEADAAAAERMKEVMKRRLAEEAARKEQERLNAEAEAAQKVKLDKANAEMAGLFNTAKAQQAYIPKAKVSKKIKITDPQAFLAIVSTWWQREGATLTVDELSRIFRKQITFCEKLANKENFIIESPALEYIDDVKAQ